MALKILGSVLAFLLMVAFCGVAIVKLQDTALAIVVLIGLVMMSVDLWQSLREKDD